MIKNFNQFISSEPELSPGLLVFHFLTLLDTYENRVSTQYPPAGRGFGTITEEDLIQFLRDWTANVASTDPDLAPRAKEIVLKTIQHYLWRDVDKEIGKSVENLMRKF